jgi:hypothetical protein
VPAARAVHARVAHPRRARRRRRGVDDARDRVPRVGARRRGQRGGRQHVLGGSGCGCQRGRGVEDGDYARGAVRGAVRRGAGDGSRGGVCYYYAVGAVLGDGADYDAPGRGGGFVFFVLDFHCWREVSFCVGFWRRGGAGFGKTHF